MFLALVLSIGVIMVFSYFQQPVKKSQAPPEKTTTAPSDTAPETTPALQTAEQPQDTTPAPPSDETPQDTLPAQPEQVAETGDTVPFQTETLRGYFSLRGARLGSAKLKNYYRIDQPDKHYDLVNNDGHGYMFEIGYPRLRLNQQTFRRLKTQNDRRFHFRTRVGDIVVDKMYEFDPDRPYQYSLRITLTNRGEEPITMDQIDYSRGREGVGGSALRWGPGFGRARDVKTQLDQVYWYYGKNDEMDYLGLQGGGGFWGMFTGGSDDGDTEHQFVRGPIEWSAVSSRYFIAAVIPRQGTFDSLFLNTEQGSDTFTAWSTHADFVLGAGDSNDFEYDLYLGPKEYYSLQSFHSGLESTLNYGWFTILALPLLWTLNAVYGMIPNYGVAIIILSVLIKVILYPLTKKGLVSMQKMRELQPEMKKIQEKYKDDKEKLNQKLMEFYQENNMNPLGGCMPMLLQLPIFIGLYRMLEYSIELRGAPFMLWVTDLSSKDPYYILPVLMGIIMFFQQKYTMSVGATGGAMGQQQQMMMYVMPVVFVFMFMNFPVGLVLYWMTNSMATVIQYWLINRSMESTAST